MANQYYGRFRRGGPSLWRGSPANLGDGRAFAATVKISTVQNTIIELVQRGSYKRPGLAKATGIPYDSLCRHIRLLIDDGVLCEDEAGRLAIAPLDQEVG
jgi:hypothetical protein